MPTARRLAIPGKLSCCSRHAGPSSCTSPTPHPLIASWLAHPAALQVCDLHEKLRKSCEQTRKVAMKAEAAAALIHRLTQHLGGGSAAMTDLRQQYAAEYDTLKACMAAVVVAADERRQQQQERPASERAMLLLAKLMQLMSESQAQLQVLLEGEGWLLLYGT